MQDVLAVGRPNLRHSQSPLSTSPDSSRRDSLRTALPETSPESARPHSPRTRLSRKRAADLDVEAANHPRFEDLALNSASTSGLLAADPTREQVCLCQPEPKIPRPRNAFILYRQHFQAHVVAQHPGLANPEISKKIGEQWTNESQEVKTQWKRLAEEEKVRHSQQYPGYRYQPRRSAKNGGVRPISASPSDEPGRCPKCNGRYISTPSTPLTPFTPGLRTGGLQSDPLQPPFTPSRAIEARPPYLSLMQNPRMDTPRGAPPRNAMQHGDSYAQPQSLPTHHEIDDEMEMMSPDGSDMKRRRFNQESYRYNDGPRGYAPSPLPYTPQQSFGRNGPPPQSAGYRPQQHQQRLPPTPGMLGRPPPGSMGPPPQPQQQPRHQYTSQSAKFDESLRLPPLQTQLTAFSPTALRTPDHRNDSRESQAKSVEAMVMTIPYLNKIKLLSKVSPPLAPPGPTSPALDTRGATLVVEGADKELRDEIGAFIEEHLRKDQSCAVKTWNEAFTPNPASKQASESSSGSADTDMGETNTIQPTQEDPFTEYLNTMADWHTKSREIIKHITNPPTPTNISSISDFTPKQIPIALIPTGFSLTTSDKFALKIPINDSYAPVDHWQWMATLWRGVIGPDLTIYVAKVGKEEMTQHGGVEIRRDCSAVVVRVLEGGIGKAGMDEKTARRLGFEVLEFVRNPGEIGFGSRI